MIIDCHVHIGKTEKTQYFYTVETYRELMAKNGIDGAVIFPNVSASLTAGTLNKVFITKMVSIKDVESPVLGFYVFLIVDPKNLPSLEQIWRNKIHGVKFHPSITRVQANSDAMDPFWECCKARGIPALVHCGRDTVSHIRYVISAARKFPAVNFIGAHLGGNATELIEEALDLLGKARLDNVYLDTSAGRFPDLIRIAVEAVGSDKILFGSDVPYADLKIGKICVELAKISDADKEAIFYTNTKNLLGENS